MNAIEPMETLSLRIRKLWLKNMGHTDEEIAADIDECPLDLREEMANFLAMQQLDALNKSLANRR